MNRIREIQKLATTVREHFKTDAVKQRQSQGETFFLPESYTESYQYPLVVWLHHEGGNERQISEVMPHISCQNYIGVGIRGCRAMETSGHRFGWSDSAAATAISEQMLFRAIGSASERYSVNPQKIFLAGYGDGGTVALRIGLRYPGQFAGIASIGGRLPTGGRLFPDLQGSRGLSLFLGTFRDSTTWTVDQVCHDLRQLYATKLRVNLRQYPEAGELCTVILADLNRWMMSLVTGQSQEVESTRCEFSTN